MKGKKLLFGMLPLSAAMILAACNPSVPASSSSNPASEETPSSEIVTPTPTSSETSKEEVTHREGLNKTLAEGAVTRDYDERFDKTIEDFSGESLNGVSDATRHNAFLREVVDSNLPDFQNSPDAAIFKMAAGALDGDKTLLGSSIVHLSMRVTEGKLPLKDLVFAIRPSDDIQPTFLKLTSPKQLTKMAIRILNLQTNSKILPSTLETLLMMQQPPSQERL